MIGYLPMYVVTTGTKDFGDAFVVRRHIVSANRVDVDPKPLIVAKSHKLAIAQLSKLHPGLTRLAPKPEDNAVIVESWL